MTNYTKTMGETLESMYISEDNIAILRDIVKRKSAMPLKFADGKMKVDLFTASAVTQVLDKVNPANKTKLTKMINTGKKGSFIKIAQVVMKSENDPEVEEENEGFASDAQRRAAFASGYKEKGKKKKEEVEIEEGKYLKYSDLLLKKARLIDKKGPDSSEVKEVNKEIKAEMKRLGIKEEVDLDENKLLDALKKKLSDEGGAAGFKDLEDTAKKMDVDLTPDMLKKMSGIKQHRDGDYILEEAELDEDIMPLIFGGGIIAALLPVLFMSVREIIRGTPLESSIKKIVDKLKKNKNYKMSDSEKSDVKGFVSKVKKEKPSLLQKAMKKIKEEVELGEGTILVADPKTQKVIKIDEKDWPKYEKKGYVQAEGNELDEKADLKKLDTNQLEKQLGLLKIGKPTSRMKDTAKRIRDELKSRGIKAEEVDLGEASARADAKRAMRKDRGVDPADVDSSATDDDVKAASKNIIMQLRKSVSLRGNFPVEFMDKKKVKVDAKIASAVQDKYNSMRKADDKEKFQAKIAKSYKDMLSALKESIAEGGYVGRKDPMPAGKELAKLMKKKGKKKKESTILDRIDQKVQERKNG